MFSFTHEDNICSICLTPKHIEDKYIHKIHVCNHTFHVKCLNMWYDTCHNSKNFPQRALYVKGTLSPSNTRMCIKSAEYTYLTLKYTLSLFKY